VHVTLWTDGIACPAKLAEALSGNNVVIGLGGDPDQNNATCIIFGVGQPDAGPTLQYLTEDAVTASHILNVMSGSASARSFVVTAIVEVDAGLYTYVAESVGPLSDGGYEQFDTLIQTPLVGDLATQAEALADAGYIITASAWRGQPYYTLVGTRAVGSAATHTTTTVATNYSTLESDSQGMLSNGYVLVSFTAGSIPADGGSTDLWLIGEK
jgi:hypothetical protein